MQAIYAEKVQFMQVNWGDFPGDSVDEAHRAGVKVLHQVGSVEAALKAAEAGVDAIIVQGIEAGGHVLGQASGQTTVEQTCTRALPASVTKTSISSLDGLFILPIISSLLTLRKCLS